MAFEDFLIHIGVIAGVYAILTTSLNLSVGFTGLLNLGHVAFFGIGAYTSALLTLKLQLSPVVAISIGAFLAALAGALLAIPTARLRTDYLALATLGFTFIMQSVARNWTSLTRGALGLPGIPPLFQNTKSYLIASLALALASFLACVFITKISWGKKMQAVRDDELAASTLGINALAIKASSLALSAAIAGMAGGFLAHYLTFIDPTIFSIDELVLLLSMLIVGGLASLPGSLIGASILVVLSEGVRFIHAPSSVIGPLRWLLFALFLMAVLIAKPKGILGRVDLK